MGRVGMRKRAGRGEGELELTSERLRPHAHRTHPMHFSEPVEHRQPLDIRGIFHAGEKKERTRERKASRCWEEGS